MPSTPIRSSRFSRRGGMLALLIVGSLLTVGGPAPARGAVRFAVEAAAPSLTVTPAAINPGGLIAIAGRGFTPRGMLQIQLTGPTGTPVNGTIATLDAAGALPPTGIALAYNLAPGPYTVIALEPASGRQVTSRFAVRPSTPHIAAAPSSRPGTAVRVTGTGFAPREAITLALDGAALPAPSDLTAGADGAFAATAPLPTAPVDHAGASTLSAVGAVSRVPATTGLAVQPPLSAPSTPRYSAGGLNTTTARAVVQLFNARGTTSRARLTFFYADGKTYDRAAIVRPFARTAIAVADLGLPPGAFGLSIAAAGVTARLDIDRAGKDGDALTAAALGATWYLAEGSTDRTFQETVSVLNPDPTAPARVRLRLSPAGGGPGKTVLLVVPPHTDRAIDVDTLFPRRALGIVATADRPVAIARTLVFGPDGYGVTTHAGIAAPATAWFFPGGTTVYPFQTYLSILNPGDRPARVTAGALKRAGGSFGRPDNADPRPGSALGSDTIVVAPHGRATVAVHDLYSGSGVASVVTSDRPVVVEQSDYLGPPNVPRVAGPHIAGATVAGRNGAAARWSFAGDDTTGVGDTLLLFNPSPAPLRVDATAYGTGNAIGTRRVVVGPGDSVSLDVRGVTPGATGVRGVTLQSADGRGFVAEQILATRDGSTLRETD